MDKADLVFMSDGIFPLDPIREEIFTLRRLLGINNAQAIGIGVGDPDVVTESFAPIMDVCYHLDPTTSIDTPLEEDVLREVFTENIATQK